MPVPPRGTPMVVEAETVPEVTSKIPVAADRSWPVPPNWVPIAVPFQLPWTTVPNLELLLTIRLPPETTKP